MKKVLTIAGSDCSGGAGIQADIKTITAHKMYAMSVITSLTAQNTTGVYGTMEATPEFVGRQIDCVFDDIPPDSVKIGMAGSKEIIGIIAKKLKQYHAEKVVVDPVMVSSSGSRLLAEDAVDTLASLLFPLADMITPNIPEAEILCGFPILEESDMLRAAKQMGQEYSCAILLKGGHLRQEAVDVLYFRGKIQCFRSARVQNLNTHGTGCTLSSAIACQLANGCTPEQSVQLAKEYLTGSLEAMLDLGKGSGPLDHMYRFS